MLNAADTSAPRHSAPAARRGHALPPDVQPQIRVEKPGPWLQLGSSAGFEWTVLDLPIPNLPEDLVGLRLLHLSDFHARNLWDPAYDHLIERVTQNRPDLIVFTGDFVDNKRDHRPGLPTARKLINSLHGRLGTVAILGNHDGAVAPAMHTNWMSISSTIAACSCPWAIPISN